MLLTYKFEVKVNKTLGIILGHLSYASSKLFNVGNYERKEYKSLNFDKIPNWYEQKKRLKDNVWYKSLPSQTAQDVLFNLDKAWKSYFVLYKKWEKKNININKPEPPYYKKDGSHSNFKYLNNSFKVIDNKIRFMIPKELKKHLKDKYDIDDNFFYIKLKKSFSNIKQIEFSYISNDRYSVYIIYEKEVKPYKEDNNKYISIDIGLNNLVSIYNINGESIIYSGGSLKNTIYYFSKNIAKEKSKLDKNNPNNKHNTSKKLKRLYDMKNKRINLIIHRVSKEVVNYCLKNDISKVIIGDISGILNSKKEFNNNKEKHKYNQNMHSLCFKRIYDYLSYKLNLIGVHFIKVSEAYSSTVSPSSPVVSKEYSNKSNRITRGLYKDENNIYNSDIVGAYNIMRIYRQINNLDFVISKKGLSSPKKECIPVTDQFFNEDYIDWNGKSGNVGVSGRNYPKGEELARFIIEAFSSFYRMLGNSIAE